MIALRLLSVILIFFVSCRSQVQVEPERVRTRWTVADAVQWKQTHPWLRGSNFAPSSAINQLEMWQADSFDSATIDRELGYAESLGFNSMRVFLHNLLWQQDSLGFLNRINTYLSISKRHGIGTVFVLFDGVWNPRPQLGKQPLPKPHVHNSGWVQSPGNQVLADTMLQDGLRGYVQGVIGHFASDNRIDAWDLFNEPENYNNAEYKTYEPAQKERLAERLLSRSFQWARAMQPKQPLTAGVWQGNWSDSTRLTSINRLMLTQSDIISFHNYDGRDTMEARIQSLQQYGRPILCTEYMARPNKSTFQDIMPLLKQYGIGAYNWGFVSGKTNTIYPWDSWTKTYTSEPPLWFHDIFRPDGSPYKPEEVALIKQLTQTNK